MADVLIVGAGPVGLTLAGELARHGARCRIVDRLEQPSPYQDGDGAFAKAYGTAAGFLVRPDGYIGWRGRSWRDAGLLAYLREIFLPNESPSPSPVYGRGSGEGRARAPSSTCPHPALSRERERVQQRSSAAEFTAESRRLVAMFHLSAVID